MPISLPHKGGTLQNLCAKRPYSAKLPFFLFFNSLPLGGLGWAFHKNIVRRSPIQQSSLAGLWLVMLRIFRNRFSG
jgi:hypothetical protein